MVIDESGQVVAVNPATEETFGYVVADAIGGQLAELITPPALRPAVKKMRRPVRCWLE